MGRQEIVPFGVDLTNRFEWHNRAVDRIGRWARAASERSPRRPRPTRWSRKLAQFVGLDATLFLRDRPYGGWVQRRPLIALAPFAACVEVLQHRRAELQRILLL
jgi:hypothetical protein